ncbi:MAG: sensor domain-containing diguanylate cyclase [Terriglobia bacterium]
MVEAELYVKYQSYAKAIELLEETIERYPRYLPAKQSLEDIYRRTGKFDLANGVARQIALISAELATERASKNGTVEEEEAFAQRKQVEKTDSIIKLIYESTEIADILKTSAQQLAQHIPVDRCVIISLGKEKPVAKYFESCGEGIDSSSAQKTAKLNFSLLKKVSNGAETVAIDDTLSDSSLSAYRSVLEQFKIHGAMVSPLRYKSELIGMIVVHRCTQGGVWTDKEKTLFATVSGHVAVALSNARQFSAIQTLAITDKLTNVYNRRFFEERMQVELSNARQQKFPLSLALLDIDFFKRINDTFGHAAGDKVLCKLGFLLNTNLRKGTVIARFGGEEFVVILPNTPLSVAQRIMEGIRKLVSESFATETGEPITVSVGVEEASLENGNSLDLVQKELIEKADAYLYQAKRNGRNRVCSGLQNDMNAERIC